MKFAILFFALFSLFGCADPFETPKPQNTETGYFSLGIEKAARTIVPADLTGDFAAYTLAFTVDGKTPVTESRTAANLSAPVELSAGTWDLTVTAYWDADDTAAAAQGILAGIVIEAGQTLTGSVTLSPLPISGGGTGTFSWKIEFAADLSVTTAGMTITPLDAVSGTAEQTRYFIGGTPLIDMEGDDAFLELEAGYYRVVFNLANDTEGLRTQQRQTLHIYTDRDSHFDFTFEKSHLSAVIVVTNGNNAGEGSLRQAISAAPYGGVIAVDSSVHTIELTTARLVVDKDLTIEGNGVTITRGAGFPAESATSQLMSVATGTEVTIRRVWFKDGRSLGNGAAINNSGNLTLESCIFSGNQTTASNTTSGGGAIYTAGTGVVLNVTGCTFYGNSSAYQGGAISFFGMLRLEGNLFYGNTAPQGPVVYRNAGTVISIGYNAVDVAIGTGNTASGWSQPAAGLPRDTRVTGLPVSPLSLKLLVNSGAANRITARPADYPLEDFYGDPIPASNAAAGAVQSSRAASGYYLGYSVNDDSRGSVSVSSEPDNDGLYDAGTEVILTANLGSNYSVEWLVNGENKGGENPLTLTMTAHYTVHAVFSREFTVDNFSDASGSETTEGTLRHALTNAADGDIIRLSGVTPGTTVIELTARLSITGNITIEGNGVTITRDADMAINSNSQLMYAAAGTEATIRRVWFKDGRVLSDRYAANGGAIYNQGNLTLESCIFSGNQTSDPRNRDASGGAIYSGATLNVKGCTFYNNSSDWYGGAIHNDNSRLTLTGNLFYGNTATTSNPVVYRQSGTVTSLGYNVVDKAIGTGNTASGWSQPAAGLPRDTRVTVLPVSPKSFRLLDNSDAAGVITARPVDYPVKDFYGEDIPASNAAAGAVQGTALNSGGFYLDLSVNDRAKGSITPDPALDSDGLYTAGTSVTLTPNAESGYTFGYWLQDGEKINSNPLTLNLTDHMVVQAVFTKLFTVTNPGDASGSADIEGTLRHAMANALDDDLISIELAAPNVIELTARLPDITANITIEGNGVTITRGAGMAVNTTSQLMNVSGSAEVTIRRVHFKDGWATGSGAAISKAGGNLTLESCIFSGNQCNAAGGAIYIGSGLVNVTGCTFYNNSASSSGGAICNDGRLTLAGNLFYRNTADQNPVVYNRISASVTSSRGSNVVDVEIGTEAGQSGWAQTGTGIPDDIGGVTGLPVSGLSFKLLDDSEAKNLIDTTLLVDYPVKDFYGEDIPASNAAAGAVQGTAASGFYLDLSVNDSAKGSITGYTPNADSTYTGTLSLTATPVGAYSYYWLHNGKKIDTATLNLNLTDHTTVVQAVFYRLVTVTNLNDAAGTAANPTLRYAITNAQDDDVISLSGVTAGTTVIQLTGRLPDINKRISIEGNGVIITKAATWTSTTNANLMYVTDAGTARISRVHFKNGYTSSNGGAIYNNGGNLTVESCIFSGNRVTSTTYLAGGGAIFTYGGSAVLNVKGCTFYNNASGGYGGAILIYGNGTLTLTGNLFYRNTAPIEGPVVRRSGGTVTSLGYNVVDKTIAEADFAGPNNSGWAQTGTGIPDDIGNITGLPVSPASFRLLSGSEAAEFITTRPDDYPVKDFYGNSIEDGASAGAVQAEASGYYLGISMNDNAKGSITGYTPNADSTYTGTLSLTATPVGVYSYYWLHNGKKIDTVTLTLNLTDHTTVVQAVFYRLVTVNPTEVTLRDAITNAQDDDLISIELAAPNVIELTARLPDINKRISIEGNGVTITRDADMAINSNSQLMYVMDVGTAHISGVHFKDGDGGSGAAILNRGNLTLESCIFSGNQSSGSGGAISNSSGTAVLNVKGCTFYNNSSTTRAGAIYNSGQLTLAGNLFYRNTADQNPVVYNSGGIVTSLGYNVVDVAYGIGTSQAGWNAVTVTGDDTLLNLLGSYVTTPFTDAASGDFTPVSGISGHIDDDVWAAANMPATDFYGVERTWTPGGAPGAVK